MHDATRSNTPRQYARINAHRSYSDTHSVFNLLTSDTLLDTVERFLPPHRERLYPPTETLSMFLAQAMSADRSCQNVVNQSAVQRLAGGLPVGSTRTGAYCQARQRLPLEMVSGLTRHLGGLIDTQVPDTWRWQGRRVRIVDGTTLSLPDTPANQAVFPQQRNQQPGVGFPICRLIGITCLASGALLDAAVGCYHGKGGDEQTLLRAVQDRFRSGDIVLGDAYFATYFFIAAMQARGVDIVMEQHGSRRRSTDFRRGRRLGPRDHVIVIDKPKKRPLWMSEAEYAEAPEMLELRELKAGGKTLVTTLQSTATAPKAALKTLYQSRWQVELDLRHIKATMGLGILSCKTPEMAEKEIWVYLLAYNLIRLMMAQSALLTDIAPRAMSFKHCLQLWMLSVPHMNTIDREQLTMLWLMMAQQRVGNRPGRLEPRAVKRRPKAYPLLTKTRAQAREEIRLSGHTRKLN